MCIIESGEVDEKRTYPRFGNGFVSQTVELAVNIKKQNVRFFSSSLQTPFQSSEASQFFLQW
jgi:hypothetical protein